MLSSVLLSLGALASTFNPIVLDASSSSSSSSSSSTIQECSMIITGQDNKSVINGSYVYDLQIEYEVQIDFVDNNGSVSRPKVDYVDVYFNLYRSDPSDNSTYTIFYLYNVFFNNIDLDYSSSNDFLIYFSSASTPTFKLNYSTYSNYETYSVSVGATLSYMFNIKEDFYNQYSYCEELYQDSYDIGYDDGTITNNAVVSVFSGIVNVAMVPINMFLKIFDFEILGINVSSFVSGLLTVCCIIIVIKLMTGKNTGGSE